MNTGIGITPENLAEVAHSLGKILADEFVLYTKTRKAHWNVEGPDFYIKHTFFEKQYGELEEIIDEVAERIRMLGHYPPASLKEYLELTHLTEQSRSKNDSLGYTKELLADHQSILTRLRENIEKYATVLHDAGSSDYITGLLEKHEKNGLDAAGAFKMICRTAHLFISVLPKKNSKIRETNFLKEAKAASL